MARSRGPAQGGLSAGVLGSCAARFGNIDSRFAFASVRCGVSSLFPLLCPFGLLIVSSVCGFPLGILCAWDPTGSQASSQVISRIALMAMVPDEPILVESSSGTDHSGGDRLAVWAVPGGAAAAASPDQSGSSDQPKASPTRPGVAQSIGDSSLTSASMTTTSQEDEEQELARRRETLRRALAESERSQPRWPGEPEGLRRRPTRP